MVVAVGLNPALDRILVVPGFAVGETLKAESVRLIPSGKATNVAVVLRQLGVPVRFVGFVGREEVQLYRSRLTGVATDIHEVDGTTRTDTTIIDPTRQNETHIREPGFRVDTTDLDVIIGRILRSLSTGDLVMMSGSLPPGAPADTYARLIESCHKVGVQTFLDTSGIALAEGVQAVPTYIKPNLEELTELTGWTDSVGNVVRIGGTDSVGGVSGSVGDSTGNIVEAARGLISRGTKAVSVTLGGDGALLVDAECAWRGSAAIPDVVNTVGCGDAFACGWMSARIVGRSMEEQLSEALVLGGANAMSHGAGNIADENITTVRQTLTCVRVR
jgi:1-phosphofructokinase